MTQDSFIAALAELDAVIAKATEADPIWRALHILADSLVGAKLFTVMRIDWANDVSGRAYTSDPENYPASGTKKINRTHWFEAIHKQRKPFVANTIADIAEVFPDHEKIWSLGCGSVINYPVIIADQMHGTVNLLHEEHYYMPERVSAAGLLALPAKAAFLAVRNLEARS